MVEVPVKLYLDKLLKNVRDSIRLTASLDGRIKTEGLLAMADRLQAREQEILEANRQDVGQVGKSFEAGTDRDRVKEAVGRVTLTPEDLEAITDGLRLVASLPDPVGEVTGMWTRPNGMQVSRMRVPIGVIAVISDVGPKVAVESLGLCLKSGNVCILRTNPDWKHSDEVIFSSLCEAAEQSGIPAGAITLIDRTERDVVLELLRLPRVIDAIIVQGSPGLRKLVAEQARMPVLCHDGGVSYVYVDADADLPQAQNIVVNSKAQSASASNATDTLLVHQGISRALIPGLVRRLMDDYKVEVRGCPKTIALTGIEEFPAYKSTKPATDEDWGRQFLSPTLAVKIVTDMDEALSHITRYGPGNTAVIVTRGYAEAMRFTQEVDASAVAVNASTRLHDGHEFGLGGQIGISTSRTHARGPLALEELTCQKYVLWGTGQLRQPHPIPVPYEDAIMLKKH